MRSVEMTCLALESMWRSPLRSILASLGVAVGSGALVTMVAFALGLQTQAEAPFEKLGLLNNIEVRPGAGATASGAIDTGNGSGEVRGAGPLDEEALERLSGLPGVACAYPDLRISGIEVRCAEHSRRTYAVGLPREALIASLFDGLLCAGRFFGLDGAREVVVARSVVEGLGFDRPEDAVGENVSLRAAGMAPGEEGTFRMAEEQTEATIVGVFEPPGLAGNFGAGGILVPVDIMSGMPRLALEDQIRRLRDGGSASLDGYATVIVRARRVSDVRRVEKAIREMGFSPRALLDRLEEIRTFFAFMDVLLAAVGTVALVVAGLGILNTLLMTVLERYQEIGLYKALGASSGDVRGVFLAEAGFVGLIGGLSGLLLACVVSWGLQMGVNLYMRSQEIFLHPAVFHFPLWLLAGAVVFSIFMSVVSGLLPAVRASRIDPIQALR